MTVTAEPAASGRATANAIGWTEAPPGARLKRRRGRLVAGVVGMLVCAWAAASLVSSAGGDRQAVALANDVDRFGELTRDDLRLVSVGKDQDLDVVSGDRVEDLVGRKAGTGLVGGSLLHEDQLLAEDDLVVGDTEAVVGTVLEAKDTPDALRAGADVEVVVRPATGSDAPKTLAGWVLKVSDIDTPGNKGQRVSLVVPADSAAEVSAAAADDRVSLAVQGGS